MTFKRGQGIFRVMFLGFRGIRTYWTRDGGKTTYCNDFYWNPLENYRRKIINDFLRSKGY